MKIKKNPDSKFVAEMMKRLKDNNKFCPCKLEKIPENKCMCEEFRAMIDRGESGYCHCGLYYVTHDDERM